MKVSAIVKRYIAILGRLSNSKKASFAQLMSAIERMDGEEASFSQRTFQRMLNDIEDLFQVKIKSDKSGMYQIISDMSLMSENKVTQSLHFFNYQKYLENFESKIAYDKSCMIGQEFIYDIQNAMKDNVCLEFIYTKFDPVENISESRVVAPYGLKESKGRWYLVGKDMDKNQMRIFGLDRISQLIASDRRMTIPLDFNIHKYFKYSIGTTLDEQDISEFVELIFSNKLAGYIKNFPIHPSQTIISETSSELHVKIRVYITVELVNELMQYSDDVQVIKPAKLTKMMINRAEDILRNNPKPSEN